ncbi:hypothetical protein [Roseateles sp.]|nr:hypothetical protein [Roseateles sp.]
MTWLERRGQHLFAHREGMLADLRGRGLDAKALEIETLLHEEGNR